MGCRMQINYSASQPATDVIAAMGRTEDIKFSPSNKLLAIAGYAKNKIAVFNIDIDITDGTKIAVTNAFELYSEQLKEPHGLDFFDEKTIIVTNRSGDAIFLKLPTTGEKLSNRFNLTPLEVIRSDDVGLLRGPGSASISRIDKLHEVLICSNYGDYVTRHLVDLSAGCSVKSNEVFLKNLAIPDGVCISKDRGWIALSIQKMRGVFLYEYTSSLNALSEPDGILRYVFSPHGVRFSS